MQGTAKRLPALKNKSFEHFKELLMNSSLSSEEVGQGHNIGGKCSPAKRQIRYCVARIGGKRCGQRFTCLPDSDRSLCADCLYQQKYPGMLPESRRHKKQACTAGREVPPPSVRGHSLRHRNLARDLVVEPFTREELATDNPERPFSPPSDPLFMRSPEGDVRRPATIPLPSHFSAFGGP